MSISWSARPRTTPCWLLPHRSPGTNKRGVAMEADTSAVDGEEVEPSRGSVASLPAAEGCVRDDDDADQDIFHLHLDVEVIHTILQHLQNQHADQRTSHRALPAIERRATEYHR